MSQSYSLSQVVNVVYILRCSDGSYYIGHTQEPEKRIAAHNSGRGTEFTAMRKPVALVYQEMMNSKSDAVNRE